MALLITGWTVLPGAAWMWTPLAVLVPAIPLLIDSAMALVHGIRNSSYRAALRPVRDDVLAGCSSLRSCPRIAVDARRHFDNAAPPVHPQEPAAMDNGGAHRTYFWR